MSGLLDTLRREIRAAASDDPPGIALAALSRIAAVHGIGLRTAECESLAIGVVPERYRRNLGCLGMDGQCQLLQSCVAVMGAGGLGGFVIEGLARLGIGRLTVIDHDSFVESNLNRQLGAAEADLGRRKAEVICERVSRINRAVETTARIERLDGDNAAELLQGAQVAVDALDNVPDRLVLAHAARGLGIPLVHGAVAGMTGQVMTLSPESDALDRLYGQTGGLCQGAQAGTLVAAPMLVAAWQIAQVVQLLLLNAPDSALRMFDLEQGDCLTLAL